MNQRFQCRCGQLTGLLSDTHRAIHGVCYCKDCRACSRHLGVEAQTHDALGGVEFVATQAEQVAFTQGIEHLGCLSLSQKGLMRWYAQCCDTPIGTTLRSWKWPYVGLLRNCFDYADPDAFERSFPRIEARLNTASARQAPPRMRFGTTVSLSRVMLRCMASSVKGSYRQTPFFRLPGGTPIAAVAVLPAADRERAYSQG